MVRSSLIATSLIVTAVACKPPKETTSSNRTTAAEEAEAKKTADAVLKTGSNAQVVADISGLPACTTATQGALAYVQATRTTHLCSDGQWLQLALDGKAGADGKEGKSGAEGKLLSLVTDEGAGDNCKYGGKAVRAGIDKSSNGQLEAAEATSELFVCEGSIAAVAKKAYESFVHGIGLIVIEAEVPDCSTSDPNDKYYEAFAAGTGWLVSSTTLMTNAHVVAQVPSYYASDCFEPGPDGFDSGDVSDGLDSGDAGPPLPPEPQPQAGAQASARRLHQLIATLNEESEDGGGGGGLDPQYLKMKIKVYFPKSTKTADEFLRMGTSNSVAFQPSTDDYDVVEAIKVDRSATSGNVNGKNGDMALVQIPETTRPVLKVSEGKPTDTSSATLRAGDEVFHVGYDRAVGPRLAVGNIFQIQSCKEMSTVFGLFDCNWDLQTDDDSKAFTFHGYGDHGGSGSPVFDRFGQVAGILTWGATGGDVAPFVGAQVAEHVRAFLASPRQFTDP